MKANELMIGDWVYDTILKANCRVESLAGELVIKCDIHTEKHPSTEFSPIPLTDEILMDNGFRHDEVDTGILDYYCLGEEGEEYLTVARKTGTHIFEDGFDVVWCFYSEQVAVESFHYVHQLQHALNMGGIEKEIML